MILELKKLESLIGQVDRSPFQQNRFYESDCEIIRLGASKLAITIDSMVEEIQLGIYNDPYEIGFMASLSGISDLSACGARPLGLLCSIQLTDSDEGFTCQLFQGIKDVCKINNTHLLGGDTNWSDRPGITVVGIGEIQNSKPVNRTGIRPGDKLFISGNLGAGNANAINQLMLDGQFDNVMASAKLGDLHQVISNFASGAIDTSDGLFSALSTLGELNKVDFELSVSVTELLDINSLGIIELVNLPPWYLLAGPVGEYQLLFTSNQQNKNQPVLEAAKLGHQVFEIGSVQARNSTECIARINGNNFSITEVSNKVHSSNGDLNEIIKSLGYYEIH